MTVCPNRSAAEKVSRDVSGLSKQERLDIIAKDSPELFALLDSLREKIAEIRERIHPLIEQVRDKKIKTSNGLSYLEVKFRTFLSRRHENFNVSCSSSFSVFVL
jgi:U3 small nucleolar RNA-associated protein 3